MIKTERKKVAKRNEKQKEEGCESRMTDEEMKIRWNK